MAITLQTALQQMNATQQMRNDMQNAGYTSLAPFNGLTRLDIIRTIGALPNWNQAQASTFAGIVKPANNG